MGPDSASRYHYTSVREFQSTGPVWDPTFAEPMDDEELDISIHGSRVGPDRKSWLQCWIWFISIHGSRVGPDLKSFICSTSIWYFNPRVPCGTRQLDYPVAFDIEEFQSTGPVWDPTKQDDGKLSAIHFNPRVPCGTRQLIPSVIVQVLVFQSTGPVWDPTA